MADLNDFTIFGTNEWSKLKPIKFTKINVVNFPEDQYYTNTYKKKQIVVHHTVSGPSATGDINYWLNDGKRIGTCIIIDRKGVPHQCFSSSKWSHHLGLSRAYLKEQGLKDYITRNVQLNKESIGVELDSWGGLEKLSPGPNTYRNAYGRTVELNDDQVIYYKDGYRGHYYYERYTKEQLQTLGELLLFWRNKYKIPLDYKGDEMFDIDQRALKGETGVWTHTSYRGDKSDCHPDPNLISMIKTVSKNMYI